MKKSLYIIPIFLVVIFSCKKSDSDPQPGGRYRLSSIVNEDAVFRYIYDGQGNCTSYKRTLLSDGTTRELKSFRYNEKNLLSSYTNMERSETHYYEYTYTDDSLLAHCKQFYDFPSIYLYATYNYHYDTERNLEYVVRMLHDGSIDSAVYSRYVNGRPLQAVGYNISNNITSYTKFLYTYDNRMNRTKIEVSPINDSTSFYTKMEVNYFTLSHPELWESTARVMSIQTGVLSDDMNLNTKNKNTDFPMGVNFYESCGIVNLDSSEVVSHNDVGLPVHVKENGTRYDCGHHISGKNLNDYQMVYENY